MGISEKQKKHLEKLNKFQKRENNRNWKGGKSKRQDGYIIIRVNGKYIKEHRYLMEKKIGRKLKKYEIVHHIDGNPSNNNLSNLLLLSLSEHTSLHNKTNPKHLNLKRDKLGRFIGVKNRNNN